MRIKSANRINQIQPDQNKVSDVFSFMKFCYDEKNMFEKCSIINDLMINYVSYFEGVGEGRYVLFAERIVIFEELLEKYKSKGKENAFSLAFNETFGKKINKHYSYVLGPTKQLVGYIINREKNMFFQSYKEVHSDEIYKILKNKNVHAEKVSAGTKEDISKVLLDDQKDSADIDDYKEGYEIPMRLLENKLASIIQINPNKTKERFQEINKMIEDFKKEEQKNYSEEDMDIIIGTFLEENKKYL